MKIVEVPLVDEADVMLVMNSSVAKRFVFNVSCYYQVDFLGIVKLI